MSHHLYPLIGIHVTTAGPTYNNHVTIAGPTCKKPCQCLLTSRTLKFNLIVTNFHTYSDKFGCHRLTMIIDKKFYRHRFNVISDKKFHLVIPMNLWRSISDKSNDAPILSSTPNQWRKWGIKWQKHFVTKSHLPCSGVWILPYYVCGYGN